MKDPAGDPNSGPLVPALYKLNHILNLSLDFLCVCIYIYIRFISFVWVGPACHSTSVKVRGQGVVTGSLSLFFLLCRPQEPDSGTRYLLLHLAGPFIQDFVAAESFSHYVAVKTVRGCQALG